MKVKAQTYSIVVVDIEKFGRRANPVQLSLRKSLYELVPDAFSEVGIDTESGPGPSDRGDGFFWLLPSVDRTDLTGRFVEALDRKLRDYARRSSQEAALRLRVALHQGDVANDPTGWVGEELNTACRMVDLDPLRTALASGPRAGLALAVSGEWHRQIVRHDDPSVAGHTFRRVPFDAKEITGEYAWIRVPGYDAPPGVSGTRRAPHVPSHEKVQEPRYAPAVAGDRGASRKRGSGAAGPGSATAGGEREGGSEVASADRGPFAGARFDRVNQVFGGSQTVRGNQTFHWGPETSSGNDGEEPEGD
ncbi:hypothetical protein [Streptomyces olivaceus]|uniref:hypothetical protein n=1 Tax=Streptomyces olivaceus TaxID=47716 RepID=UPI001CCDEF70|nr:hypothetical protein [Streptomyces olivaceus]MBZ6139917.1 hypothetical protein [Streptomyces olivaceus]MBZ6166178.1 hypothetical protein [Streptomyces olivaceus]